MDNQVTDNKNPKTDEIDLGQLFYLMGRGFNSIFQGFLRLFVYLKKNIIKIGILIVIGVVAGFVFNQFGTVRYKSEVILRPNFESKDYLNDVVQELQANINAKDTVFFNKIGIDVSKLEGFRISLETIESNNSDDKDLEYLEVLEKFPSSGLITEVVRNEILNKTPLNHRIIFTYVDVTSGNELANKLVEYIKSNTYFNDLSNVYSTSSKERIKRNENLLLQIDDLVENYSAQLNKPNEPLGETRITFQGEEQFNVAEVLELKNKLIRDIESVKMELQERKEAISIINFGSTQLVQKSLFKKTIVLIPAILLSILFLIDIVRYLNKKAKEMNIQ